jgi:peptidoglycan-associated lipoprotein
MRKSLLIAVSGALLIFSGCSKKMPVALPGSSSSAGSVVDSGNVVPDYGTQGNVGSTQDKSSFQKGAVNSNGKYTGSDGVSKSGIKMLYFASDSYTLEEDQVKRLMSDIPKIKNLTANGKIIVEGNCDEFGTDEYNHALGLKRAKAVKKLLISAGISDSKIDTVSYGESNPTCTVDKPACHAKNRRAEINRI